MVGRPGLDSADGSELWFKAHPREEPMNHSLATAQRGAHRAPATRDHRTKMSTVNAMGQKNAGRGQSM